jgi:hypothetical protein
VHLAQLNVARLRAPLDSSIHKAREPLDVGTLMTLPDIRLAAGL